MAPSDVRRPLPIVLANGTPIPGILSVEVQSSSFFSADRFSIRSALSATGATLWSTVPLSLEIQASLDGIPSSLITGFADSITIDPIVGELRSAGRDYASLFVGAQIDQTFENQTSSEIATVLAQRQGLAASVSPTETLIGRYYQNGRTITALTQHARATTEWDLLCRLAQLEGYDVWVSGETLFFQPTQQNEVGLAITPADCMTLKMHHALDIAGGVTVTVKSWDCVTQAAISGVASSGSSGGLSRTIVRPNLSAADAQSLASRLLGQITQHERRITLDMPGDLATTPRMLLSLSGTQSDFDGLYTICAIERSISFDRGFVQSVEASGLPWTAS